MAGTGAVDVFVSSIAAIGTPHMRAGAALDTQTVGTRVPRLLVMAVLSIAFHLVCLVVLIGISGEPHADASGSQRLTVTLERPRSTALARHADVSAPTRLNASPSSTAPQPDMTSKEPSRSAYLSVKELQRSPRPIGEIDPVYPPEAGGVQGTVVLRIFINESGSVDDVAVERAIPEGFFESAAKSAFMSARFVPGEKLGTPVKSQLLIEVNFATYNKGAAVEAQFR